MKNNKGLSDFIQKAMNTPDMIQRGKIHGTDSEIYSNLSRDEIEKILSIDSETIHLEGTVDEKTEHLEKLFKESKDKKKDN